MKKLLMLGAILALGATAMGNAINETNSEPVYLRAEIVEKNLVISGIDGREILLDFGTINKKSANLQVNGGASAEAEWKVEYVGTDTNTGDTSLEIVMQTGAPKMEHTSNVGAEDMTAYLTMSDTIGTAFTGNETVGNVKGTAKLKAIKNTGEIYRGKITGRIKTEDIQAASLGMYEGETQIEVTLTGADA